MPATEIVDLEPGEMFVHRNVANLEIADDPSFAAALQFAVEILEVQHIMIVGHQGCGGIKAATESETDDPIGRWLTPIRRLYEDCVQEKTKDRAEARTLCEVNVATQVPTLAVNPIVRKAWTRDCDLTLPGWVYAIGDGLLHEVCVPVREAPGATFGIPDRRRSRKNPDNCSD
ncbi:carbonic anhydrase [Pacificimonas sp. ICDLI1SI03]